MNETKNLKPATEMVKANAAHALNESKAYRQARDALAAEEIELRRHIVRVAEQRRDRKSTRLNSSHSTLSRMPSSA